MATTVPKPAKDVFVSHSTEDAEMAKAICTALEAYEVKCWIAPRDIVPGVEWMSAVIDGIDCCALLVLVFSGHADRSIHVRREVQHAISKELIILPFRIENVAPSGPLVYALGGTQRLDGFVPPVERRIDELVSAVLRLLKRKPASFPAAIASNVAISGKGRARQLILVCSVAFIALGLGVTSYFSIVRKDVVVPEFSVDRPSGTLGVPRADQDNLKQNVVKGNRVRVTAETTARYKSYSSNDTFDTPLMKG